MSNELRVSQPPPKPLLVYDGECQFCCRWIRRWERATRNATEYRTFQNSTIAQQFPEIPRERFEHAVQFITTEGLVYGGAEAVFRSLAAAKCERWLLWLYQCVPPFAAISEFLYAQVASHREFLSKLDLLFLGEPKPAADHVLVRYIFLRGLALIYLIAFVSLWTQIHGLSGQHGIIPAQRVVDSVKPVLAQARAWEKFHIFPTLAWWSASDSSLTAYCATGVGLALLVLAGLAPAPALFLLWLIYLSLCCVCSPFLDFQWDILLLETGFLAIFFAPLQWLEKPFRQPPPSRLILWLLRWLLFRLMFESGIVKLLSGDAAWRNCTALTVHYETQPLPTWLGWYAHQLPHAAQTVCTAVMFFIELIVPFFIFAGRRLRHLAAGIFVFFQTIILLTGNYTFFNLLTVLLCLALLDDEAMPVGPYLKFLTRRLSFNTRVCWPWLITVPLSAVIFWITSQELIATCGGPMGNTGLLEWFQPFRSFNSYGLFRVMTMTRPEIIIEGSNDGKTWLPYEFKYKPGDLKRAPAFVAPHQPRLDWQMWFAALGSVQQNRWFINFEYRLLHNEPAVTALLAHNPFSTAPPRYIRAQLYEYHFTDFATRRRTGQWWRRDEPVTYLQAISLADFREK